MKMELGIRFKRIIVRYLAHCLIVIVIAVAFTDVSQIYAQSTTDFNQLPDEAFEAGLIIDVYETPQAGYRFAVALRSEPEYIHILDNNFEQMTYFSPTQSPEVAAEPGYGFLDLTWSPDGNWLVATIDVLMASYVQIWNTNTGELVSTTRGIFNGVTAWSPNSDQVAVSEEDRTLVIDAASGQVMHQFLLPVYPQALELGWDAGGERLAARNGQGIVNIWSADSETLVFEINTENAEFAPSEIGSQDLTFYALFAWEPDGGNQIALYNSSSLNIEIWDIAQQQLVASFPTDIDNLRELHWARLGLVLYDTFPRGELGSIRVLSPSDGSILQETVLQQSEYVVAFLNLGDPEAFNIVVGTAPLGRELAAALTVETISPNPLPTATPTSTVTLTLTPTFTPTPPPSAGGPNQILFAASSTGVTELDIYRINPDGTGLTRLTNVAGNDAFPAWSPDGTQIAFASTRDGNYEIYVMNADGSNPVRLTNHSAADEFPVWSPDGSQIAFSSQRDGNWELYVMNADGSNPLRLTNHSADDLYASWSPDGSRIAFSSLRDGNYEIYVVNPDGSNLTRLTTNSARDEVPNWSPDGSQIAFTSNRDGNLEIYAMNADGTNVRRLTSHAAVDEFPNWSPDGSEIVFSSSRSSFFNLFLDIHVMNADGTSVRRLTSAFSFDRFPAWGYP